VANPVVVVDFLANTRQLQKSLADAEQRSKGFGSKLAAVGKMGALAAGAAGVGALVATLKIGIGEWSDSTKVATQTNAVIKSTGGIAKVTAKHVDDLASSMLKKTGIDDEAIKSGENLLLTFTDIRNEVGKGNDVFDQATHLMADMSTALGQDMKTSALQLGKALNDPVKGMTALRRVGVSFTQAQTDQVKALQASGDKLGAQKVILRELTKEFGGSAEAAGKTLPGQINVLRETFNNFAGDLVGKMIPVLQNTVAWLRDHWPEISRAVNQMWASVKPILTNLADLFVQVVKVVRDNWSTIGPVVMGVAKIVQDVAKIIGTALKLVTDLLRGDWAAAWNDAKKIVGLALDAIKTEIETEIRLVLSVATRLGGAILEGLNAGITGLVTAVETRLNNVRQAIVDAAATAYQSALALGGRIMAGVVAGIAGVAEDVRAKVSGAWQWSAEFLNAAVNAGRALGGHIVDGIKGAFSGLADLLKAPINAVIRAWNSLSFHIPTIHLPEFDTHIPGVGKVGGGTIGGQTWDFPKIPLLARGGVVDRPTLAMLGEGPGREIAAPESLLRQLLAEARPNVRVFIGERELRDMVRVEVVSEQNRTAQTLIAGLV
jgi:hypothetical protein